jgi:hypothetical protein
MEDRGRNLKRGESVENLWTANNRPHLCIDGYLAVFKTRRDARREAARTGGEAYLSKVSKLYLIRFN